MSRELLEQAGIDPTEQFDLSAEELACGEEVVGILFTHRHLPLGDVLKSDVISEANRRLESAGQPPNVNEDTFDRVVNVIVKSGLAG